MEENRKKTTLSLVRSSDIAATLFVQKAGLINLATGVQQKGAVVY